MTTSIPSGKSSLRTTSFSVPSELHKKWKERLPHYGDSSKVITELMKMFLDGKVKVVIPQKEF